MKRLQKETLLGYLPIVPFALIVVCYELLPLAQLAASSLVGKESGMVGLENFIKVFTTPLYQMSIRNSIRISLLSALVGILVAFLAARFCHLCLYGAYGEHRCADHSGPGAGHSAAGKF